MKVVCIYSEKGGVGKTTILASLMYKLISKRSKNKSLFAINTDMSSYSLLHLLKYVNIYEYVQYKDIRRNALSGLMSVLESINSKFKYLLIDMQGSELEQVVLSDIKEYIDIWILPFSPTICNIATPISTVEMFKYNGIKPKDMFMFINNTKPHNNSNIYSKYIEYLDQLSEGEYYILPEIYYYRNLENENKIINNSTISTLIEIIKSR